MRHEERPSAVVLGLIGLAVVIGAGCEVGPRSGRGLRLPEGDIEQGAAAFRALGCERCHDVVGVSPAAGGERADTILTLGGEVTRVYSYGELVTSIVNPSHRISRRYPEEETTVAEGVSRMENFNDRMTVAQLIDLVAFLQSKYELRRDPEFIR